jgi:methionyl-tRNA formyltransferase
MIAFFGTPEFAAVHLEGLLDAGFPVSLVVTRADRPRGRGRAVSATPVKTLAAARGIPVLAPPRARDGSFLAQIAQRAFDLFVVVAYGSILPASLLAQPRLGSVNLHASLLPRWRGAAPVQRAILAGDTQTGVTSMFMDEGVDTGDIILAQTTAIGERETAGELLARLAPMGRDLLVATVRLVLAGNAPRQRQDSALATHAPPLTKEDGWIRWSDGAAQIARFVRGMTPWPGARTLFRGETATILEATPAEGTAAPGTIVAGASDLLVGAGDGLVRIEALAMAGRRRVSGAEFLRGARVHAGETFAAPAPAGA